MIEKKDPLISVIIPVYNQERNIDICFRSILAQEYRELEIILVDDGSTDHSPELCDDFARKDSRAIVLHISNGGVANARNIALDICKGKYITFVDPDDFVSARYVRKLYELIVSSDVTAAFCKYRTIDARDVEGFDSFSSDDESIENKIVDIFLEYDYGSDFTLRHNWAALYKREAIGDIRFDTDIYVGEDALFNANIIKKSSKIAYTNETLYYYVRYGSSASHGVFDVKKSTVIDAWSRIIEIYKDKSFSFLQGCYKSYAQECHNGMRSLIKNNFDKGLYLKTKKALRWVYPYIRKSDWGFVKKASYFFLSRFPKLYYFMR